MRLTLNRHKYPMVLALISAGILSIGTVLKPEKAVEAPVTESEMVRLRKLAQRRSLQDMTSYFAEIAGEASQHVVRLGSVGLSGIVWDGDGTIVTARPEETAGAPLTAEMNGRQWPAELAAASPGIPVSAVQIADKTPFEAASLAPASTLGPGSWVVAVARRRDGLPLFAPGIYSGSVQSECRDFAYHEVQTSLPLGPNFAGGGLFDMDGNLLAVIARCGDRYSAIAAEDVHTALEKARSLDGQMRQRYGMQVTSLDEKLRTYFGAEQGAAITEVSIGGIADRAGLLPGDVILALDGEPVRGPDDLERLILPLARTSFDLRIRRDGKAQRIVLPATITAAAASGTETGFGGLRLQSPSQGYVIGDVQPGSAAEQAGLRPGDRLLLIDGAQPRTPAALRRVLAANSGQRRFLVVGRGRAKLGIFLQ